MDQVSYWCLGVVQGSGTPLLLISLDLPSSVKIPLLCTPRRKMGDTFDTDAHANGMPEVELKDYPRQTSLLNELYQPLPILDVFFGGDDVDTSELAGHILRRFSVALRDADQGQLQGLFFPPQSFYRDTLALTYHSRTFKNAKSITFALLRLSKDRGARDFELAPGSQYMRASPTLVCFGLTLLLLSSSIRS